jgi:hypothetical protein
VKTHFINLVFPLFLDDGYSIARRGCRVAGEIGTCMFVWECLKTEGKHLGMCMDGFMFGSCCVHDDAETANKFKQHPHQDSSSADISADILTTMYVK